MPMVSGIAIRLVFIALASARVDWDCHDGASSPSCELHQPHTNQFIQLELGLKSKPASKILHFLSMGHSGSCFWGDLFGKTGGRPYIFEPFNENGWGLWKDPQLLRPLQPLLEPIVEAQAVRRLECIYECKGCDSEVSPGYQDTVDDFCNGTYDRVVVKTVNINNGTTLLRLPPDVLKGQKVVLMLRDPRAMHDSGRSCRRQLEMALTIKDVVAAMGKENVKTMFYERWARDVPASMKSLADWAGVNITPEMKEKAVNEDGDPPSAWLAPEFSQQAQEQEAGPWCDEFFELLGYPPRSQINVSENATTAERKAALPYNQLRDPTAAPINDSERDLLRAMQKQGEASAWL